MSAKHLSTGLRRKALTQLAALCVLVPICLMAAGPFLDSLDWTHVRSAWREIAPLQWSVALAATALSFAALGRYDVIVHRHLNTGVPDRDAQVSGAAAVAISQTIGLGLVSGTMTRWRALPQLTLLQAASVSSIVTLTFMGAWLGIFALIGLALPNALPLPRYVYAALLFSTTCLIFYTMVRRHITVFGTRVKFPSLRAIFSMFGYAALDLCFAALALWWLLPDSAGISFTLLLPIYLACLGVALASSTPGGVGPFEVTLLWALQGTNVNELLAGLIAFRLVYFAVPACLAVIVLLRPARADHIRLAPAPEADRSDLDVALRDLHPESGVARQENHQILYSNLIPIGIVARTCQASICMFQTNAPFQDSWNALAQYCKSTTTFGLLYKCSARTALDARKQGYSVARIALDAQLHLTSFSLDTPSRRSLRRKLRKAEKTGITCCEIPDNDFNTATLRAIDARWQQSHGTARGFSMGRFSPSYLTTQRVFGAWHNGTLIAFISCHTSGTAWALDLVRYIDDMPDGTMHALLTCAITTAQSEGFYEFSLASVPCSNAPVHQFVARWSPRHTAQAPGLAQFKQSFAPTWIPLYAVARTRLALLVALWDIWQEVTDPAPLPVETPNMRPHNRSAAAQFVPPIETEYPKRRSQSL